MPKDNEPQKNPLHKYYKSEPDLRFALLTADEEKSLFLRLKNGDTEARTFLIENHLFFTAQEARRRGRGKLPDEDVLSAGNEALMEAIDRFDPTKGARFTTYLRFYIRAAVSELWRDRDPVDYKKNFPESEENTAFRQPLVDMTETPDYAGDEFRSLLLNALASVREKLTREEQELIHVHYELDQPLAELGRRWNISREAVRTRHGRLLTKLRELLKAQCPQADLDFE